MSEATITELACLKLMKRRLPTVTQEHIQTMLYLTRGKQSYYSIEEIKENTRIKTSELQRIMRALTKEQLVEKEGCLYKKPEPQKIAELITCE